jgi:homoserine kinase
MRSKSVVVHAPATIANVGPGFDILGIALDDPGDTLRAERVNEPGLHFEVETAAAGLPTDPGKNVAAHVAGLLLEDRQPAFGVRLILKKEMPIGSGLGSSAASSVGAAVAVNALLTKPLKRPDLLRFAVEGERLAAGYPHADNAAAALLGGAVLVRDNESMDIVSLPLKNVFWWTVVLPETTVNTRETRRRLPRQIPLEIAVRQSGNVAALVTALARGDGALLARSFEDHISEPARFPRIPGYLQVKRAALGAGARGASIAGSGPSVFAVSDTQAAARRVGKAMQAAFRISGRLASRVYVSKVNLKGTTVRSGRT